MKTKEQIEEWLLEKLSGPEIDLREITQQLSELAHNERVEEAVSLGGLAEEALIEQGRADEALKILRLRAEWAVDQGFRDECISVVRTIFGKDAASRAYIKSAGFEQRVPVTQCLDRLVLLRALKPGTLCADKTWGFGVVRSVDPFYQRVAIDFERKPDHELSMSYAAETLELLDDAHLLAVQHREPERLAALLKDDPAEVVRMALRSYGPMSAVVLQEKLCPSIVPAEEWKTFWAAARKALKKDPGAEVPTKRTEPILVRDAAGAYDDAWYRQLRHDRDIESILAKISAWQTLRSEHEDDPSQLAAIENRLAFVIKGADLMGRTIMPRAMMLAHAVGPETAARLGVSDYVRSVLDSDTLLDLLDALSAKDMKGFIAFLMEQDRERTLDTLLRLLPRLDVTSLTEVLQLLLREGAEEACRQAVKALVVSRRARVELVNWLSRNMDKLTEWDLCSPGEFAELMLLEMEKEYSGARLKAQNQLRDRFTQKTWTKQLFDALGAEGRERYFLRLKDSAAWPPMEKRSVLGLIIKLYPDLERLMAGRASGEEASAKPRGTFTSQRAFRERQLMYERIKKVDIPNNSKEIAVARAHGDLRENFEYKAAKDTQALLMRRQAELEQMLAKVVPSDFEDMPSDKAGIGTGVRIAYDDGRTEQFFILGVWDRDETLGIISCDSKLAQALEGAAPGDRVTVPGEHGEESCRVEEVTRLSEPVRAWVRDVPETLADRSQVGS